MVTSVPMPKLGAGVYHEGVILKWTKNLGDHVDAGESIAEIETEKAVADYQSPASGTILKLLFEEGDKVGVGTPILILGQPGEEIPPEFEARVAAATSAGEPAEHASPGGDAGAISSASPKSLEVSPAARRLAENLRIDLSKVIGTGPGGSIMREDILKASRGSKSSQQQQHQTVTPQTTVASGEAPSSKLIPLSSMRLTIAERLTRSQREAAHVTLAREVEVTSLVDYVKQEGGRAEFGYNDVVLKATAEALKQHPMMNSHLEGHDKVRLEQSINLGVAVALEGGLMTPTIRDADRLSVPEIAALVRRLSEKVRNRQLSPEESRGATFTVSNLGAYGVESFTPIINPPQVGILGVGRIAERPWVDSGVIKVAPTVHLSLTFDHRVVDGADAALFLDSVARLVRDVSWLRK